MNIFWKGTLCTVLVAASASGIAAESTDVSVKGMIRPSACHVALSNGGTVDFGTISATTLGQSAATVLPDQSLSLNINCDGPTRFGVIIPDARPGTVADGMEDALKSQNLHGLGSVDGRNIGAFTLMFSPPSVDGETGSTLESWNGTTWRTYESGVTPGLRYMTAWAKSDDTTPSSITDLSTSIRVRTGVVAKDDLPQLTAGVPLDGLVTIQLRYL
nr:DUF1120 domain-containing protein [uncultured Cupriavidus sp.]